MVTSRLQKSRTVSRRLVAKERPLTSPSGGSHEQTLYTMACHQQFDIRLD